MDHRPRWLPQRQCPWLATHWQGLLSGGLFVPKQRPLVGPRPGQAIFLLIFRGTLLMVGEREVAPGVLSRVTESDDSLTSVFGCSNDDSDAVDPDLPELGRCSW